MAGRIVRALADWATAVGATRAFLQVEQRNTPAVTLYRTLGFTTHHTYLTRHPVSHPTSPRPHMLIIGLAGAEEIDTPANTLIDTVRGRDGQRRTGRRGRAARVSVYRFRVCERSWPNAVSSR